MTVATEATLGWAFQAIAEQADTIDRLCVLVQAVGQSLDVDLTVLAQRDQPGVAFARARVEAEAAGRFGDRGVEKVLEAIMAAKASALSGVPPADANDPDGTLRRARIEELRRSGVRVWRRGTR